mmetsp:Transcript_33805/g.103733  ORF Transcript_33805/g.103733 Transcript_33805/m.103733 type:complete len:243 (-) Transcript_33805:555-1283(-)
MPSPASASLRRSPVEPADRAQGIPRGRRRRRRPGRVAAPPRPRRRGYSESRAEVPARPLARSRGSTARTRRRRRAPTRSRRTPPRATCAERRASSIALVARPDGFEGERPPARTRRRALLRAARRHSKTSAGDAAAASRKRLFDFAAGRGRVVQRRHHPAAHLERPRVARAAGRHLRLVRQPVLADRLSSPHSRVPARRDPISAAARRGGARPPSPGRSTRPAPHRRRLWGLVSRGRFWRRP